MIQYIKCLLGFHDWGEPYLGYTDVLQGCERCAITRVLPEKKEWEADVQRVSPVCIDSTCGECGRKLVLYDTLRDEKRREADALMDPEYHDSSSIWYDEWVCPNCLDGVYYDWPDDFKEKVLGERAQTFKPMEHTNG